jgi:hypothetical protein
LLYVEADLTRSTGVENPPTKSQISPLIKDTNLIEDLEDKAIGQPSLAEYA